MLVLWYISFSQILMKISRLRFVRKLSKFCDILTDDNFIYQPEKQICSCILNLSVTLCCMVSPIFQKMYLVLL